MRCIWRFAPCQKNFALFKKFNYGIDGGSASFQRYIFNDPSNMKLIKKLYFIGILLLPICVSAQSPLILFRKGNLWGLSRADKTIVLPCVYDEIGSLFIEGAAWVRQGEWYGSVNEQGQIIVPCIYQNPIVFSNGFAKVAKAKSKQSNINQLITYEKIGFINQKGIEVIPCIYRLASDFRGGYAFVCPPDKLKLTDSKETLFVYPFHGQGAFIDPKGKLITPFDIEFNHEQPLPFFEKGVAFVQRHGQWAFINSENKYLNLTQYEAAYLDLEAKYGGYIVERGGNYGVCSFAGTEVIPTQYAHIIWSEMGYWAVNRQKNPSKIPEWGILDTLGRIILDFTQDQVPHFSTDALKTFQQQYPNGLPKGGMLTNILEDGKIEWTMRPKPAKSIEKDKNLSKYKRLQAISPRFVRVWEGTKTALYDLEAQKMVIPFQNDSIMPCVINSKETPLWILYNLQTHVMSYVNLQNKRLATHSAIEPEWALKYDATLHELSFPKGEKWGLISAETGKILLPFEYETAFTFNGDLALVRKKGFWGVINRKNEVVLPFEHTLLDNSDHSEAEGMTLLMNAKGNHGFINAQNQVVIPFDYEIAESFRQGIAVVAKSRKYGLWNNKNKIVLPFEYENLQRIYPNRGIDSFVLITRKQGQSQVLSPDLKPLTGVIAEPILDY